MVRTLACGLLYEKVESYGFHVWIECVVANTLEMGSGVKET